MYFSIDPKKYYKTKKYCKEKYLQTIQKNEEKNKKREYGCNWYRKLFIQNQLSETEKKMKNIKMNAIYVKIFLRKKTKGVNMYTKKKHITFSEEEKEKSVNMLTEDVEIFLNNFNSLRTCKKVFWFKKIVLFKQAWESFLGAR